MSIFTTCEKTDEGAKWYPLSIWQKSLDVYLAQGEHGCTPRACRDEEDGDGFWMRHIYVGKVISLGEYNGYDDSDFYAVVWDDEKGEVFRSTYATTRGWTYHMNATVDATPEVMAKYNALCERKTAEYRALKAAEAARTPEVGKRVKVVRGRKVPQGTEGVVFWKGTDKYHRSYYSNTVKYRLGLKDDKGITHWTAADNVEVIQTN